MSCHLAQRCVASEIAFVTAVSVTMPWGRAQLAVSDEVEWFGVEWNAADDEHGHLFGPAAIRHGVGAPLDAIVQRGAAILTQTDTCMIRGELTR
jgi:hypothetical protein